MRGVRLVFVRALVTCVFLGSALGPGIAQGATESGSAAIRRSALRVSTEQLTRSFADDQEATAIEAARTELAASAEAQSKRVEWLYADAVSARLCGDDNEYASAFGRLAAAYSRRALSATDGISSDSWNDTCRILESSGVSTLRAQGASDLDLVTKDLSALESAIEEATDDARAAQDADLVKRTALAARPGGVSSQNVVTADTVGDVTIDNGILRISVRADGAMHLWRKAPDGSWISQVYGDYSKGTRLAIGSTSWGTPSGTFNMATQNTLAVVENTALGSYGIRTVFSVPGTGARLTQTVRTTANSDFVQYQWNVSATSEALYGVSLIHGQDTWFNDSDYGEGHYDKGEKRLAVTNLGGGGVTASLGSRGHVGLKAVTSPSSWMEGHYSTVQQAAQSGALVNDVRMDYHDAAYAFSWNRSASIPRNTTWAVKANEKVNYGHSEYATPVILVTGFNQTSSYGDPSAYGYPPDCGDGMPGEWYDVLKDEGRLVFAAPATDGYEYDYAIAKKGDLRNNSWRLQQFLNSYDSPLLSDNGGEPFEEVDVIGYSMGGVLTRGYGKRSVDNRGMTQLRRVVTLGSPHNATLGYARLGLSEAAHQMSHKYTMDSYNKWARLGLTGVSTRPLLVGSRGWGKNDGLVAWDSASYLPYGNWYALPIDPAVPHTGNVWIFMAIGDQLTQPYIGTARWDNKRDGVTRSAQSDVVPYLKNGTKPPWAESRSAAGGGGGGGGW